MILAVSLNSLFRNYGAELFAFGCRLGEKFDDSLLREAFTTEGYARAEARRQRELGVQVRHTAQEIKYIGHAQVRGLCLEQDLVRGLGLAQDHVRRADEKSLPFLCVAKALHKILCVLQMRNQFKVNLTPYF